MPIVIVQNKICGVGFAGKIQVISKNIIAEDRNITLKLKNCRFSIQHFRGGKLHFVVQVTDSFAFGEHDFGTALFLDLFSHFFDAP